MGSFAQFQRKRAKASSSVEQPARILQASRSFEPPQTAPTSEQTAADDWRAEVEHAARFGHSLARMAIHNPATAPQGVFAHSAGPSVGQDAAMSNGVGVSTLQRKEEGEVGVSEAERDVFPTRENQTGLPDALKAGVETLSGLSLDDVQVHYNSAKPAEVQALAYTQGAEIHVGPGQEEHLAHEAWHVVQQKQGRVQPTLQAKGVAINDDEGLEREASVIGGRAGEIGQGLISRELAYEIQSGGIRIQRTLKKNEQNTLNIIQRVDDKKTFEANIKPHFEEIQAEKGENIAVDALYHAYVQFALYMDLTTDQFAKLLKAKNINPGGKGGPAQSRSLQNLISEVLPVIEKKANEIAMLRTCLKDSPIGASTDFNILLKKIGEGDIQEFKLDTLIDEITLANGFFSMALEIKEQIRPAALKSIHEAYIKSIESAESKVLKKLNRELNAALHILTHDHDLILKQSSLSYTIPSLSENAEFDLLFGNRKTEESILVEVQSVPNTVKKQHGEREPIFEAEQDIEEWQEKTLNNLITYLVETMYHKRQQLSMVQQQNPELRSIPIVFLFTRPLPTVLYDALNKSGMFIPVMQPGQPLSELITNVLIAIGEGTQKTKNPAKRLAIRQEEEALKE